MGSLQIQNSHISMATPGDMTKSYTQSHKVCGWCHWACNWLDLCGRFCITLNPEKFRFAQDEVGSRQTQCDHARSIYLRLPQNLTDLGLVWSTRYDWLPFREPSNKFHWDEDLLTKSTMESRSSTKRNQHVGNRLVEKRHRLFQKHCSCLTVNKDGTSWEQIHPRPHWRRSTRSGRCPRQGATLCPWVQKPNYRSGP